MGIGWIHKLFLACHRWFQQGIRGHQTKPLDSFQSSMERRDNLGNFGGAWFVPTFNLGEDRHAGLGFALEAVALNELALKANQ